METTTTEVTISSQFIYGADHAETAKTKIRTLHQMETGEYYESIEFSNCDFVLELAMQSRMQTNRERRAIMVIVADLTGQHPTFILN